MRDLPSTLRDKEWYAFLELEVPERNFADKVYVELTTVSITNKTESGRKVECENVGEHLSDCFIARTQINPENEYLKVKLSLMSTMAGKIYI